jgi:hypothetical protein
VINMSFEVDLPTIAAPLLDLVGLITQSVRNSGSLIFAASGNHGLDVDHTDEFLGIRYRPTLVAPCILRGVTCVGGIGWDSSNRAGGPGNGSNIGSNRDPHGGTVAIYGPYDVWIGPDPLSPANSGRIVSGTSVASPFVAGVAALVMAANPALGADQVERILLDTAHTTSRDPAVFRWVNARAAVRAALAGATICQPPSAMIVSPSDGFTVNTGATVTYSGLGAEVGGALPASALSWTDNGLGIATGATATAVYSSPGTHTIVLTSHGCSAVPGTATITVNVVAPSSTPNSSQILSPADGARLTVDSEDAGGFFKAVSLSGTATTSSGAAVPGNRLRWTAVQGATRTALGTGNNPVGRLYNNTCVRLIFTIVLEVLDAAGNPIPSLTRSVTVSVDAAPC